MSKGDSKNAKNANTSIAEIIPTFKNSNKILHIIEILCNLEGI